MVDHLPACVGRKDRATEKDAQKDHAGADPTPKAPVIGRIIQIFIRETSGERRGGRTGLKLPWRWFGVNAAITSAAWNREQWR